MMLAFPPLPTQGYPSAWDVSLLPSLWLFGLERCFFLVKIASLKEKEKGEALSREEELHAAGLRSPELLRRSGKL